jgi:hypothetical protein
MLNGSQKDVVDNIQSHKTSEDFKYEKQNVQNVRK